MYISKSTLFFKKSPESPIKSKIFIEIPLLDTLQSVDMKSYMYDTHPPVQIQSSPWYKLTIQAEIYTNRRKNHRAMTCQSEDTLWMKSVSRHSGDNYRRLGSDFIPGLGIKHPRTKCHISSDRTLGQKNHDKNTKKPTGELKITILILVTFFSLVYFTFFPLVR